MDIEYHTSKSIKIFMYLFMAFAVFSLISGYQSYLKSNQADWLVTAIIPLIIAFVVPFWVFRKVVITPVSVKVTGPFQNNELQFSDIAGYRLHRIPRSAKYEIVLYSASTGNRLSLAYQSYENGDALYQWIQEKFTLLGSD